MTKKTLTITTAEDIADNARETKRRRNEMLNETVTLGHILAMSIGYIIGKLIAWRFIK